MATKLKCKPCNKFYADNGKVSVCEKCGGELRRIKVHTLKPSNLVVTTGSKLTAGGGSK